MRTKVKSLRQACIERGIDPDNTGYKGTKQRLLNVDRIIPGVPDRISPAEQLRNLQPPHPRSQDARKMYPPIAAHKHAVMLSEAAREGKQTECYVALFCILNNLTDGGASWAKS